MSQCCRIYGVADLSEPTNCSLRLQIRGINSWASKHLLLQYISSKCLKNAIDTCFECLRSVDVYMRHTNTCSRHGVQSLENKHVWNLHTSIVSAYGMLNWMQCRFQELRFEQAAGISDSTFQTSPPDKAYRP